MTNVAANELNYDKYTSDKYDLDIVNSIPYHKEVHELIAKFIRENYESNEKYEIIDLGVGTGITSKIIQELLPNSTFDVVDFSNQMLEGAKKKLGLKNVNYIAGDYSTLKFDKKYDVVISVIGLHHQTHEGKKIMFQKIHEMLKPKGVFIFADLVTYTSKHEAALNNAKHYHHLVEKSSDEKTLKEWAHHHMFLNNLATVEDQIHWLKETGFEVNQKLLKINTTLLICTKK